MTVLVAGGRTMIGPAVVRRLAAGGIETVDDGGCELTDAMAVDRLLARVRPQQVVMVGGRDAGIAGNLALPADLMVDNLLAATHVMSSAVGHGVSKLLYLGSSCMYPGQAPAPLAVESLWSGPLESTSGSYAVAKLAGMQLCAAYRQQYGVPFITAIKADMFGPGDDYSLENSHVVAGLMRRMHDAKQAGASALPIWGTGRPRRDFTYVDDVADAIVFLLSHYDAAPPINVGTGTSTSIRELAALLQEVIGYRGELRFETSRPDGMASKVLDSSPLNALGWRPAWGLRDALMHTYQSFLQGSEVRHAVS